MFDENAPEFHRFIRWAAVLDLVEARVRAGETERLAGVLAPLEVIAAESEPPVLRVGLTCAKPLMAPDERG